MDNEVVQCNTIEFEGDCSTRFANFVVFHEWTIPPASEGRHVSKIFSNSLSLHEYLRLVFGKGS